MLIAPGAIVFLIARRFETMLVIATVIAVTASVIGVFVSFFLDSAPAPTTVLLLASGFTIAFVATRQPPARQAAVGGLRARPAGAPHRGAGRLR